MTAILATDCNADEHRVEGNRDDGRHLVVKAQRCLITGINGRITIYSIRSTPLSEMTEQTSAMKSDTENKIAASITTRSMCIVGLSVVRIPETLRSIVQIRYASNPGQNSGKHWDCHRAHADMCLPVPNKLVASDEAKNAVRHCNMAVT
jgi:hypothetical protein